MCLHVYRVVPDTPLFDIQSRPNYDVVVNKELGKRAVATIKKQKTGRRHGRLLRSS